MHKDVSSAPPTDEGPVGYRADVDGLRAIAVVSVILYHIRSDWLPGGYVGVDVFFVISGFLITRNIWGEMRGGRFSLGGFYLRRIRRIAPASLLVTLVTLCAGALLLQPEDLERLARSAVWSALSAANIYFWKYLDTDYFAESSDQEPLLHMWSLGVEEQFYLLWPALLILLAIIGKRRSIMLAATIAIGVGALAVAELTNVGAPKFSFFMLPARAGELMMGAIIALAGRQLTQMDATGARHWSGEILALCGLGLLGFALWGLDDADPFPGINVVYPCLGAALLIIAGQMHSTIVNVLLTARPVVFVGLISYSLYLWHWPILAFIRYFYGEVAPNQAMVAAIAMIVLSVVSYLWVEQPARRMHGPASMQVVVLLAVPVLLVMSLGAVVIRTDGLQQRGQTTTGFAKMEAVRRQTEAVSNADYPCQTSRPTREMLAGIDCVVGDSAANRAPEIVLWGDSNAGHYIGVLREVAERGGFAFRYLAVPTCPPVFGRGDFGASYARQTCHLAREGFRLAQAQAPAGTVVLAGQWSVHERRSGFSGALQRTIGELRKTGAKVVVLAQVPLFPNYGRECPIRWARLGGGNCAVLAVVDDQGPTAVNRRVQRIAEQQGAAFLDVHGVFCRDGQCSPYLDGQPVYFNQSHLSGEGARLIGRKIAVSRDYPVWISALTPPARAAVMRAQPAAAPVPSRTSVVPFPSLRLSLPGGYEPGFVYSTRSQRHETAGHGKYRHVVILEYMGILDPDELGAEIASGLSAGGLVVERPEAYDGGVRLVARGKGAYLTVYVRPDPKDVVLKTPGAKGIIYFGWKDAKKL